MQNLKVKITGISPILMHSDQLANPLDPLKKLQSTFTSKRKKTDEDHEEIARIEWTGALYYDEATGPFIPGRMIKAMLIQAAKKTREAPKIKSGMIINTDKAPLQYKGPRTPEKLWNKKEFADMRSVVVQRARIMRCRPIFHVWGIDVEIVFDENIIDRADILRLLETGGQMIGIGDYRPENGGDFGRFISEET